MSDERLLTLVTLALKPYNLTNLVVDVQGTSGKAEGFTGSILFVIVSGIGENKQRKTFNLAIKSAIDSKTLREAAPIRETYLKEIHIYENVKPAFDRFLEKKGLEAVAFMPHCYATCDADGEEALVFEDLKVQEYGLWKKNLPMTDERIRIILQSFGRWHALSWALKDQEPEAFKALIKGNLNLFSYFLSKVKLLDNLVDIFDRAKKLAFASDEEFLDKLHFSTEQIHYILTDKFFEDPDQHVILHGDCWTNNFLFKEDPLDVKILDWQASGLASPAIDLSHFIYACCDTGVHTDVTDFLKIYYESFSSYLRLLGSDPEKLFPFEKLEEQWKKFSTWGLILGPYVLQACLSEPEDIPDWAETMEQGKEFSDNLNYFVKDVKTFARRVRNNMIHYVQNSS